MKNFVKYIILIGIIMGVILNIAFIFSFEKKYPEEAELTGVVRVVSNKTEKERSNCYTAQIISSNLKNTKDTKIIVYTSKNENFEYGDILKISGDFSKGAVARNYKGFSYRNYLKQSKIYGSMYAKTAQKIGHKKSIMEKIMKLKLYLYSVLDKLYKGDTNAFLKGILLR